MTVKSDQAFVRKRDLKRLVLTAFPDMEMIMSVIDDLKSELNRLTNEVNETVAVIGSMRGRIDDLAAQNEEINIKLAEIEAGLLGTKAAIADASDKLDRAQGAGGSTGGVAE
jgi:chromosome segregation ATPase